MVTPVNYIIVNICFGQETLSSLSGESNVAAATQSKMYKTRQ